MIGKKEPAVWPLVLVLAGLFAWCVAEPRSWERRSASPRRLVAIAHAHRIATPSAPDRTEPAAAAPAVQDAVTHPVMYTGDSPLAGDADRLAFFAPPDCGRANEETEPVDEVRDPSPSRSMSATSLAAAESNSDGLQADDGPGLSESVAASDQDETPLGPAAEPVDEQETRPIAPTPRATAEKRPGRSSAKGRTAESVRRSRKKSTRPTPGLWGEPTALIDEIDRLAYECDAGEWAVRVGEVVREIVRTKPNELNFPRTALALKRLRDLVDADNPLLIVRPDAPHKGELRRLRYAVLRRLDLWELVPELAGAAAEPKAKPAKAGKNQTVSLSGDLRQVPVPDPRSEGSGARLQLHKLFADLERFEQTGLTDDGRELASDVVRLAVRDERLTARTRRWLEWNYRNSNLRFVVSNELVNRLVPAPPAVEGPVHDRILGVPTRGWSSSTARLSIRLIPDPRQIRFALEAKGIVFARTASRRDPVTVYSNSDSAYLARKQFQLTAEGLQAWPTQAEVSNSSRLRGIETDYDDVPVLGSVVEAIARAKHAETEPAVRRVARRKVATRVQEEIDSAIEPKLEQAKQLYRQQVVTTLEGLALQPTVIELQSTEARLTSRLRLAGDEQLAASTPRPMALIDSLASVQIHQSLVNNVCDRLDVDGRTFTLPELQQRLVAAFKLPPEALSEEYPTDLQVTFAKRDAVVVRFDQERVELTLGVAELRRFPKSWRDFQVRVYYRPRVAGLDVRLVRDGTVQLRGEHFGREPQIALRGIFSKVFSHDRELVFFSPAVLADPRLAGLGVTQCTLSDGWIGLSFGNAAVARQARRMVVGPLY